MSFKNAWTLEEDSFLKKIVPKKSKVNWTQVMELFNENFSGRQRTSKQCRQRYLNYSKYSQSQQMQCLKWQPGEIDNLFNQFLKWGPRWNLISKAIPQKSGNSIKNKFYGGLRKTIRRINHAGESQGRRLKKKLKYESVIRIIEAPECIYNLDEGLKHQSIELRQKIVKLIRADQNQYAEKDANEIINAINKFNLLTRSYKSKRVKKQVDEDHFCANCKDFKLQIEAQSFTDITRKSIKQSKFKINQQTYQVQNNNKELCQERSPIKYLSIVGQNSPVLQQFNELSNKGNVPYDEYMLEMFPEKTSPLERQDLL